MIRPKRLFPVPIQLLSFQLIVVLSITQFSLAQAQALGRESDTRLLIDYSDRLERLGNGPDAIFRAAANIDTAKRIGRFEAYLLGNAYFRVFFGDCGGAALPQKDGSRWLIPTKVGPAGVEGPNIFVEKDGVTYSLGKRKMTPRAFSVHTKT